MNMNINININEKDFESVKKFMVQNGINFTTNVSWFSKLINFFQQIFIRKEDSNIKDDFYDRVNDKFVNKNPLDSRLKNLPIYSLSKIKEKTFEKYPESFLWTDISKLNLSDDFIENNFNRLDKHILSNQKLSPYIIIKFYEYLIIRRVFEVNDMVDVYMYLYEKDDLDADERSFLSYLNVWDITEDYQGKLQKIGRSDIVDKFFRTKPHEVEIGEEAN